MKETSEKNIKEKLYQRALGVALAKLQTEVGEINPQMLTAVVNLLKLDERNLKTPDTALMSNFIKGVISSEGDES